MQEIIAKAAGKLAPEMQKEIVTLLRDTAKNLELYLKSKERGEKLTENVELLKQKRSPTGLKPFKLNSTAPELEQTCTERTVTITFGPGTTFREAKRSLFYVFQQTNEELELEMVKNKIANLREATAFKLFLDTCKTGGETKSQTIMNWGLDVPAELFQEQGKLTQESAASMYKALLHRTQQKVELDKAKKEKESNERKVILDKATSLDPQQVLNAQMKQTLKELEEEKRQSKRAPGRGKNIGEDKYDVNYFDLQNADSAVKIKARRWTKSKLAERKRRTATYPPQGNGQSPGAGLGKGKGETKGKGKGKDYGKNGKGKSETKGKGKAKGKKGGGRGQNFGNGPRQNGKAQSKGARRGKGGWSRQSFGNSAGAWAYQASLGECVPWSWHKTSTCTSMPAAGRITQR